MFMTAELAERIVKADGICSNEYNRCGMERFPISRSRPQGARGPDTACLRRMDVIVVQMGGLQKQFQGAGGRN